MSETKVLSWIDSLSKLGGTVAGVALIGSVVYDWGYLSALGLSFSDIPTSISDHIRSALIWVPTAVLSVCFIAVAELFLVRIEKGMSEEEIAITSPHPKFTAWFRRTPSKLILFTSLIIVTFYILFGHRFYSGLSLALPILWIEFIFWVIKNPRITEKLSKFMLSIIWLPPIVIWIASVGYASGSALWYLDAKPIHSIIYLKNEPAPLKLQSIRLFDKGVIFKSTPDRPVVFVKWEDVIKIENISDKPWQGVLKEWLNIPNGR